MEGIGPSRSIRAALEAVAEALQTRGERFGALQALGDAVRSLVSVSDRGLRGHDSDTAFARSQRRNIAVIRKLSLHAAACTTDEYAFLYVRVRSETVRACRTQVRKIRLSRARMGDAPGGEG